MVLVAAIAAMRLGAGTIAIVNPGFETPVTSSYTSPAGWSGAGASYNPYLFGGGNAYYNGANSATNPGSGGAGYLGIGGENLAYVVSPAVVGAGLYQILTATLQAGQTYTLNVEALARNGTFATPFGGSVLELLAGSTVIATASDSVGPAPGSFEIQTATVDSSTLSPSLIGQALEVLIGTTKTGNVATDWDNISLVASTNAATPTPEPSSVFLLLPAVLCLGLIRRKK